MRTTVHIVQRMAPGGLEALALQLVLHLPQRHVLVSLEGDAAELTSNWGVLKGVGDRFFALHKKDGLDPLLVVRLSRLMKDLGASCVVTHHIGPLLYAGLAARLAGVAKVVHVEHDAWHYKSIRRRLLARALGLLVRPHVIAVSQAVCEPLASVFPGRSIDVIANGVDVARYHALRSVARERLGLAQDRVVVGSVGRLERVKGHDVLVRAAAACPAGVLFVIIGDGSERRSLEALAHECGVADRVRFVGHVDDPAGLYAAFDVFCLPSRAEGLPLALLEAQAADVRIVASNVGDVARGSCPLSGRLVAPDDAASLALAICDSLADTRAISPRAFIEKNFSWSETLQGYARIIGV